MTKLATALLIDGDNIPARAMPEIMEHARRVGDPIIRCVFGDFSQNRLADWVGMAQRFALELVFQPSGGKGKNSTDIAMTIRTMDLLNERICDCFCLVSSDRDFAPLARRLVRAGVQVFGIGESKADCGWREACTEFFILTAASAKKTPVIVSAKPVTPMITAPKMPFRDQDLQQIQAIIGELTAKDNAGWIALATVATTIRKTAPDLAGRFWGKGKFLKNLRESGLVLESGTGSSITIRLKGNSIVPMRAASA